jgi:membrane protein DedA with SNARE-associated domain
MSASIGPPESDISKVSPILNLFSEGQCLVRPNKSERVIMFEPLSFVEHFSYLGLFILLVLGTLGFPFPEDSILILNGFLVARCVVDPLAAFFVVYTGLLITDYSLYWVGRTYGRGVIEITRFQKILTPERLSRYEVKFQKWGGFVVFFGRFLLGVRAQVFLTAGILRLSRIKFLIFDGASAAIMLVFWGAVGFYGDHAIQAAQAKARRMEHVVVIILVLIIAAAVMYAYIKSKRKEVRPY